jgi:hypothetical protein
MIDHELLEYFRVLRLNKGVILPEKFNNLRVVVPYYFDVVIGYFNCRVCFFFQLFLRIGLVAPFCIHEMVIVSFLKIFAQCEERFGQADKKVKRSIQLSYLLFHEFVLS